MHALVQMNIRRHDGRDGLHGLHPAEVGPARQPRRPEEGPVLPRGAPAPEVARSEKNASGAGDFWSRRFAPASARMSPDHAWHLLGPVSGPKKDLHFISTW